ncbi:MAG: hypothetical protein U0P46_02850 [Holophagaceae bacterium]
MNQNHQSTRKLELNLETLRKLDTNLENVLGGEDLNDCCQNDTNSGVTRQPC